MRILITGGAGFIGANLCNRLLKEKADVVCLDNFFSSSKENISEFKDVANFSLLEHEIINPFPDDMIGTQFHGIYHLACPASPPEYQKDHIYTLRVNFEGTKNVLDFAKKQMELFGRAPKILFTSTSEVYGDPLESPQKEDYRGNVNPHGLRSCYDEGKRVAESLCMNYWRKYEMPMKIVRIFNTYGPFMDPDDGRAVSNFITRALKGKNLDIYGDGKQTRSFQYIDDLIEGLIAYMNLEEDFPGPINLGNPNEISILELAEKVIEMTGADVEMDFCDLPDDDPMQRCPEISLAKKKLGWMPGIDLETGLKKTIEYFRSIV
jgi:UDP-glucuronate decarboxylase